MMQIANEIEHHVTIPVRRYFPVLFLLVLGVAVSFVLFMLVHSWEQTNQRIEFESRAKTYADALENTLNEYVEALLFLGDFYNNSLLVTRQEFTALVKNLMSRNPGIQAFSWNPLVKDNERSIYELAARKEGFDDFEFTERTETKQLVRAVQREEYIIVYYIHPLETNRSAFGFDIASNKTRLEAITKGFDTGRLAATGRITLVQETRNQFGTLLLLPIYHQGVPLNTLNDRRKSRKGFVAEVLRIGEAVEAALKGFSDEEICMTLYDMSAGKGNRFLYHRPSRMSKTANQPIPAEGIQKGLFWGKTINFAGRLWKVLVSPSDFYYQSREVWQAWIVLFGSLLLTTLLAFYMLRKILYTAEIEQRIKKQFQTNQKMESEIRERIQVEKALKKERDRAQQYLDVAGAMLVAIGTDQNVTMINKKGCEILGYSEHEIVGKKWFNHFIKTENIEDSKKVFNQIISGNIEPAEYHENPVLMKNGEERNIAWHNAIIRDESGSIIGTLSSGEDITNRKQAEEERKKLEHQLQQAQKMEAIGTLAGGIAHDFNNILSPLVGYSEILKEDLPVDNPFRDIAETMLNSTLRAKDLVKQILTFSRKTEAEIKTIKIQPILKEALKLLRSSIPKTIGIQQNIDSACGSVNADSTQIHQVIMNLATNAYHAMEETGGKLTITLDQIYIEPDSHEYPNLLSGTYARLTVSDTGIGMDNSVREKIFEPYFTTKETGKGTGLGLSVVHGIVKSFGGAIRIFSEPGKGTDIHVSIPIIDNRTIKRAEITGPVIGGTEKILLVDDEADIIHIEQRMLERLGYHVTTRTGSVEALEAFKANPDKFDLIITDMTMPNMTGIQLAREIKKIEDDIPIIICTGFSEQLTDESCQELNIQGYLMKPVVIRELAITLRKILDTPKGGT